MGNIDNKYKGMNLEYHIIQSFPVSCLNRDDVGSPKSAFIGGVNRARVSSQAWKRQVRMQLHELGVNLGLRTKHIKELILSYHQGEKNKEIEEAAQTLADMLCKDTLHFMSHKEAKALYDYLQEHGFDKKKIKEDDVFKTHKKHFIPSADGLDIALFGRMVAKTTSLNVEAASSFSHAISTHKVDSEIDFFSALDDYSEEDHQGAGHIGIIEYNSATYYRYISLNVGQLVESLGSDEELEKAIEVFTKALYAAIPFARQATMSGASPWDYARVLVRKGQRLQASFDEAVQTKGGQSMSKKSIERLNLIIDNQERMSGSMYQKIGEFRLALLPQDDKENNHVENIDELIKGIKESVKKGG